MKDLGYVSIFVVWVAAKGGTRWGKMVSFLFPTIASFIPLRDQWVLPGPSPQMRPRVLNQSDIY